MTHRLLLALSAFMMVCAQARAQDGQEVGVILIKKKMQQVPPDTGRYQVPLSSPVEPGFIRCGYRSDSRSHAGHFFAGVQYFNYTYIQLGMESSIIRNICSFGFNLEGNVDKKIYGASIFLQRPVLESPFMVVSAGAVSGIYLSKTSTSHSAGPYIALSPVYQCLRHFQLSYGYNYIFGDKPARNNEIKGSFGSLNTHSITLRYSIPFYL